MELSGMTLGSIVWISKNRWNNMEYDGKHSISHHHLCLFSFPPDYAMEMEYNQMEYNHHLIKLWKKLGNNSLGANLKRWDK